MGGDRYRGTRIPVLDFTISFHSASSIETSRINAQASPTGETDEGSVAKTTA